MFNYDVFLLEGLDPAIALLLLSFAPDLVYRYYIATDNSVNRPTENTAFLHIMREAYIYD